jgi:hypothetical protein
MLLINCANMAQSQSLAQSGAISGAMARAQ